jgi:hypothetical protein
MKSNNVLIVATEHEQRNLKISNFYFEQCTGVIVTEFKSDNQSNLISWVKTLTDCQLVVTTGSCLENIQLFGLVSIARQLQIPVIHESNFQKYVEQQYN